MRTTFMAKGHEVERKWLVVDAEGTDAWSSCF